MADSCSGSLCAVVHVIDPDREVRVRLTQQLTAAGFEAQAFDCASACLEQLEPGQDNCLILDFCASRIGAFQLIEQLHAEYPWMPVIITTQYDCVESAVTAIKLGAFDVLYKPINVARLIDKLYQAFAYGRSQRCHWHRRRQVRARLDALSLRERQVLRCVLDGQANKQIAQALTLSQRTVEVHRSRIMRKLDAASFAELVKLCWLYGDFEHEEPPPAANAQRRVG